MMARLRASRSIWSPHVALYLNRDTGVTATVSCPGPTATEFAQVAGDEKTALFKSGVMSAHAVAEDAYRAMMQGKVLSIPGFTNKLKAASLPFAPRRMKRNLAAKLNKAA